MKNIWNNRVLTFGIVGLIVGFGLGWYAGKGEVGGKEVTLDKTDLSGTANVASFASALSSGSSKGVDGDANIEVSDQKAGGTVAVSAVDVDSLTWIAIRDNNDGIVGNILGAKRVEAGKNSNVEVPLLRKTVEGKKYFVVLFKDNGDMAFDYKVDSPMTGGGELISKTFTAN